MFKYIHSFLILLLLVHTIAVSQTINNNALIRENDEEYKLQREQWYENMHRSEPGVNWKIIENENRLSKYELKKEIINDNLLKGNSMLSNSVSIGNSGFKGYWSERGSNNLAGRIHTACIDESSFLKLNFYTVYAASAGGNIWKGTLGGSNWTCMNDNFRINDLRMLTTAQLKGGLATRVIAVGYNPPAVYYTDNNGTAWNKASGLDTLAMSGWIQRAVVKNSTGEILLLTAEYGFPNYHVVIYSSTNNGQSFTKVSTIKTNPAFCDIWTPRYDNDDVYIVHQDTISKFVNNQLQFEYRFNSLVFIQGFSNLSQTILQGTYYQNQIYLKMLFKDATKDTSYIYSYNKSTLLGI